MTKKQRVATQKAIQQMGGVSATARRFKVTRQAVQGWRKVGVPIYRILDVERISGISRHDLCPALYPREMG